MVGVSCEESVLTGKHYYIRGISLEEDEDEEEGEPVN